MKNKPNNFRKEYNITEERKLHWKALYLNQ